MTPRILAPVIFAADALLAAVLGIALPLAATTAIWISQGLTGDWGVAFATGVAAWALSLGGGVTVTLDAAVLAPLGIAGTLSFAVGMAPLALTLATIVPAYRSGARLRDDDGAAVAAGLAGPLAFAVAAWGLAALASHPVVAIDALRTAIVGGAVYLVALLIGARPWDRLRDDELDRLSFGWGPRGLAAVARGIGIMIVGVLGLGAAAFGVGLIAGMGRILSIFQALHLDVVGAIALGFGQLALVPNAVVWSAAWLLGPGFALGSGSNVSPLGTTAGPQPLMPLLGAVPEGIAPIAIAVVALCVAVGVLAGLAMRLAPESEPWTTGWRRIATPLVAALVAACALGLLALAAGGAVGPGRLAVVGPHGGWVLLAAFGLLGIGGLAGALVPLAEVDDRGADAPGTARVGGGRRSGTTVSHGPGAASRRGVGHGDEGEDDDADVDVGHDDDVLGDGDGDGDGDGEGDGDGDGDGDGEVDDDDDDDDDVLGDDDAPHAASGRGDTASSRRPWWRDVVKRPVEASDPDAETTELGPRGARAAAATARSSGARRSGENASRADATRADASRAGASRDRASNASDARSRPSASGSASSEPRTAAPARTPRDDDEPDIYAGIDPLADR